MEMKSAKGFVPYIFEAYEAEEMLERSKAYYELMNRRRSVRAFSDRPVSRELVENIVRTASTAPSGAHKQPWTFCLVSSPEIKSKIREAAEEEERENYGGRMSDEWLKDLEPFETNEEKPFLERAPYLIVVFKKAYDIVEHQKKNNYYVNESVGLATGFLLAAIHNAGLASLTHTPSPMNFLTKVLNRPDNERPFLLIPVGFPAEGVEVPDIQRKPLSEVLVHYD